MICACETHGYRHTHMLNFQNYELIIRLQLKINLNIRINSENHKHPMTSQLIPLYISTHAQIRTHITTKYNKLVKVCIECASSWNQIKLSIKGYFEFLSICTTLSNLRLRWFYHSLVIIFVIFSSIWYDNNTFIDFFLVKLKTIIYCVSVHVHSIMLFILPLIIIYGTACNDGIKLFVA